MKFSRMINVYHVWSEYLFLYVSWFVVVHTEGEIKEFYKYENFYTICELSGGKNSKDV